jgi:hypothetical protein
VTEAVEVRGWYQGTSSITHLSALYSLSRRKFIKGYYAGDRVSGDIKYKLFPGKYIRFTLFSWWRMDPPRKLTISLIEIERDGKEVREKVLATVTIKFYNSEFLQTIGVPQVIDFYKARPGYHSRPGLDFAKVYSEEEHEKLLRLIASSPEIVEGEEHE